MNQKLKKKIILNIPYVAIGLFATNLGEAWRIADGINASEKLQGLIIGGGFQTAFTNPLPSLHPFDLLIGAACGTVLRLAVYLKLYSCKEEPQRTDKYLIYHRYIYHAEELLCLPSRLALHHRVCAGYAWLL